MRRGGEGRRKKKKKDKSWEGSINFIANGGLKTTKITNNHRYVNYIRFSYNSIYIKFILPFLSTRQYQLSTTYAIRKKGKKKKTAIVSKPWKKEGHRGHISYSVSVLVTSFLIWLCAFIFLELFKRLYAFTYILLSMMYNLK